VIKTVWGIKTNGGAHIAAPDFLAGKVGARCPLPKNATLFFGLSGFDLSPSLEGRLTPLHRRTILFRY